jgi:hypothetical protein
MRRRVVGLALLGLAAAAAAGCGGTATQSVPQGELDRAQAALQTALDAWKRDGRPGAVQGRVAGMADPDWAGGVRLVDYMIYNAEGRPGEAVRCGVALSLRDRQGKALTKDVVYSVRGGEPFVIDREVEK